MARPFLATRGGWMLVLGCVLSTATWAQAAPPSEAASPDEIQVKLAWLADRDTFACVLGVHVSATGLEICGRVPSEKVHRRALALAQAQTTLKIEDRLEVSPRVVRRQVHETSPEVLQLKATALLQKALGERARSLRVFGTANGVVVVNGKVRSLEEKLQVSQELWLLNCCACVQNELAIRDEGVATVLPLHFEEHAKAAATPPISIAQELPPVPQARSAQQEQPKCALPPLPAAPREKQTGGPANPSLARESGSITVTSFETGPSSPPPPKAVPASAGAENPSSRPTAPLPLPAEVKDEALTLPPITTAASTSGQTSPKREEVVRAAFSGAREEHVPGTPQPTTGDNMPAVLPASLTVPASPLPPQAEPQAAPPRVALSADPTELNQWSTWALLVALGSLGVIFGVILALAWIRKGLAKLNSKVPETKPLTTAVTLPAPGEPPLSPVQPPDRLLAETPSIPTHEPEMMPESPPEQKLADAEPLPSRMSVEQVRALSLPMPAVISVNNKPQPNPGVSVRWESPQTVRLGQRVTCRICAKNVSAQVVRQVVVRHELAEGVALYGSEPAATQEGRWLSWPLGKLQPGEERRIELRLLPQTRGELNCEALVSFTGSSTLHLRVHEPHLALQAAAPGKALLGQTATLLLTVTNKGEDVAENIQVKGLLGEGLEHAGQRSVNVEIGNLVPHESRNIQLLCTARAGGSHACTMEATAEGLEPVRATAVVEVLLPQLALAVSGPKRRYIDRQAIYTLRVSNPGSAPAGNVTITHQVAPGVRFQAASAGGRYDEMAGTVSWFLGDLLSGQDGEVNLTVVAATAGTCRQQTTAQAVGGLKAECETVTVIEGLSALQMEVVNLEDPVEIGAETVYEVRVSNAGSRTEAGLELTCTLPAGMEFGGALSEAGAGFVLQGRDIAFEPLAELAPREQTIYRIRVRGREAGDLRFLARLTAKDLAEPVLRDKITKVYADEVVVS
jgi:uncharacterized repeat protein (TIGR01451 family)